MHKPTTPLRFAYRALLTSLILASLPVHAQTYIYDARIDEKTHDSQAPFNYYLYPSDELGFKDAPKAFQLTADGAFNGYWGELTLWAGTPLKRLNSRFRTLDDGCLPVFNYGALVDGIQYEVKTFAAPVGLQPHGNLLGFCRITATNRGQKSLRAAVGARVFNHEGPWRYPLFDRTKAFWWGAKFLDSTTWKPWKLWENTLVKNGGEVHRTESKHLIFHYQPDASGWQVIDALANNEPFEFVLQLAPGQSASVDVTVPFVPVSDAKEAAVKDVASAKFDDYLKRTTEFWRNQLSAGATFEVPEAKVMQVQKTSLMYDLMARDLAEDGKTLIQKVNHIHYDQFFSRDAAFIIHTYDMLGLPETAEQCIEYILIKDDKGNVTELRTTHPDAWGQALWTLAAHYRITGNLAFVERVYSSVPGHIAKLEAEIAKDSWGLWPEAEPYDNERIQGHYTGHSFWVLRGLKDAIELATALGKTDDALRFRKIHDDYESRFLLRLKAITAQTGGYVPPGLDDPLAGMDWENASAGVYPFGVISPNESIVASTVQTMRNYSYQEGITTYEHNAFKLRKANEALGATGKDWSKPEHTVLHHYEIFNLLQTMLTLGMDREVVTDLYSFLVHTGSTHGGFEYDIWAWRDRNFHDNYAPHGWGAARYNELLRNMLVREDLQKPLLHLASALAPTWLEAGKQVRITNAPTDYGPLSYTIDSVADGATVHLDAHWRKAPEGLRFHIPWFVDLKAVKIDGTALPFTGRVLEIPASARELKLEWTRKPIQELSYRKGVEIYVDHYWKLQHGEPVPNFDSRWIFPE